MTVKQIFIFIYLIHVIANEWMNHFSCISESRMYQMSVCLSRNKKKQTLDGLWRIKSLFSSWLILFSPWTWLVRWETVKWMYEIIFQRYSWKFRSIIFQMRPQYQGKHIMTFRKKEVGLLTLQTVSASILPSNFKHLNWELGPVIKSLRPSWSQQRLNCFSFSVFIPQLQFTPAVWWFECWILNIISHFPRVNSTELDSGFPFFVLFYTEFIVPASKQAARKQCKYMEEESTPPADVNQKVLHAKFFSMLTKDTHSLQTAPMITFLLESLLPMWHYPSPCLRLAPLTWRRRLVSSDAEHSRHSDEREPLWSRKAFAGLLCQCQPVLHPYLPPCPWNE